MIARRIVGWSAVALTLICIGLLILQAVHPFSVDYLEINFSNGSRFRMPVVPPVLGSVGGIGLLVALFQLETVFEHQTMVHDDDPSDDTEVMERNPDPR